jgi:phosphohistidine phosphatase
MNLLLWRHADALDTSPEQPVDLLRPLSPRGVKQSIRMADWLDQHLPNDTEILCSPAIRCKSTAKALRRKFTVCTDLGPERDADSLLALARWPEAPSSVLLVGHQPSLGLAIAKALGVPSETLSIRKGSVWWIKSRERFDSLSAQLYCVQSPDLL